MCFCFLHPSSLVQFLKCPLVRPVGECEVLRHLTVKFVLHIIGPELMQVVVARQLWAGQASGCEAAVQVITKLYDVLDCEATCS